MTKTTTIKVYESRVEATTNSLPAGKFPLGKLVVTRAVMDWLKEHNLVKSIGSILERHHNGDWGEMGEEDCASNEQALKHNLRLMSAYTVKDTKVWIITEWDRSITTILFPDDY